MACIMTEALDHQHLHMPYRVRIFVFSLQKTNIGAVDLC